jgi:hypothetical protein
MCVHLGKTANKNSFAQGSPENAMKPKNLLVRFLVLFFLLFATETVRAETDGVTAFEDVNLVPMTSQTIVPHQTVLVRGSKIIAIGPSDKVKIPENSKPVNGKKRYLMPGLADMHIHTDTKWLNGRWPVSPLKLFLANGVTTVRDFGPKGTPGDHALYWREEIKRGRFQGPTIYGAGPILYGPVKNAAAIVRGQWQKGFDFVKLYSFLTEREYKEAMDAAKDLGIYTAGHIPFAVGLEGVLSAGMDEIAHIEELDFEFLDFERQRTLGHREWFRYILEVANEQMKGFKDCSIDELKLRFKAKIEKIITALKTSKTPLCTTLTVDDIVVRKLFHMEDLISVPRTHYLPFGFVTALRQGRNRHQIQFKGYEDFAPFHFKLNKLLLRELHRGGITLLLGTDSGGMQMGIVPGFSVHDELSILVENGLTPYEALKTATVNAAEVIQKMTGNGGFGTIEIGKRADLLLVEKNPLECVENARRLRGVMACGRWYDKNDIKMMKRPGIPVIGNIYHVHEPDNSHSTYIEIIIGKSFPKKLPDSIESITVTGPNGIFTLRKEDFVYLSNLRDFWTRVPGVPQKGLYTFGVTSGEVSGSASTIQAAIKTVPIPDARSFAPGNDATLDSQEPSFSWKPVSSDIPLFYRLEICELRGKRVYATGRTRDMVAHRIPEGVLKPGHSYRWRIRVSDNNDWENVQNRSQSEWQMFNVR